MVGGGRIEPGEKFEEALRREVKEETGLEIEIGEPIYVGEWRPVIRGAPNQIIGVFFICKPTTDKITLSTEHDEFKWVEPGKHGAYDMMDPEDKVIDEYAKKLS